MAKNLPAMQAAQVPFVDRQELIMTECLTAAVFLNCIETYMR